MKSNGWTDGTVALQLFAHLDGEALNVALLMPEEERAKWEGLSQGLSDNYNSPGRLAVFRRQFESAIRRPGMDPATFATELGILAVRGFGDMGKRARDSMIRDRFIAAQRTAGCVDISMGFLRILPSGILWIVADCGRVIRNRSRVRGLVGTRNLLESMVTLRNSDVSKRIHRILWCVWEWTRECQYPWLVLFRGTLRLNGRWGMGMVSWLPWKSYPHW